MRVWREVMSFEKHQSVSSSGAFRAGRWSELSAALIEQQNV